MCATKRNGVEVMIVETGEKFNSITACANRLDVEPKWISRVANGKPGYKSCHGFHILRIDGKSPDLTETLIERRGNKGIPIRIVETGEEFKSITACANALNGNGSSICDILNGRTIQQTYKGFHFEKV